MFFFTPTQVAKKEVPIDRNFRVGGLVEGGTVRTIQIEDTLHVYPFNDQSYKPEPLVSWWLRPGEWE